MKKGGRNKGRRPGSKPGGQRSESSQRSEGSGTYKPRRAKRSFSRADDDTRPQRGKGAPRSGDDSRPKKGKGAPRSGDDSKPQRGKRSFSKSRDDAKPRTSGKPAGKRPSTRKTKSDPSLTRLNKFIANSGVCSRREADELIKAGAIKVNGEIVTELGTKIKRGDRVHYGDELLKGEELVYLLLNKPRDFITTAKDPQGRKTVLDLVRKACKERIYPVGRLDRNTTGLLLFTNDGELADKLMHPRNEVRKLYEVETDRNVKPSDLERLVEGIVLEDGEARADHASYVNGVKRQIGLELHSGKNRVVRRMFESLGYKVKKLDRVMFAGLTKKDVPRGKWRFLTPKEVQFLKMKV